MATISDRPTGQTKAPPVTITLARDTATKLYAVMGERPHQEEWSREVWLAIRRACPSSRC